MRTEPRNEAFRTDIEPHRRAVTLHCYRMLGSWEEAEDVAQDSLIRAWQRLDDLRSSGTARAWLYRIATNACLDRLKGRRRRSLPHRVAPPADPERALGPPAHERLWIEPAPDALLDVADDPRHRPDARASMRERIGLAFVTALQLLPPKQRAALLLVDVLGWRPREAADLLSTTEASVNSLLQRARGKLELDGGEPEAPAAPGDAALVQRFVATWESGDLEALSALLAEDAILAMPPQPEWYAGRAAVVRFFERARAAQPRQYRLLPLAATGAPAVALYARPIAGGSYEPVGITLLTIRDGLVHRLVRFAIPGLFARFGLPDRLPDA